jgi:hypothetical protein
VSAEQALRDCIALVESMKTKPNEELPADPSAAYEQALEDVLFQLMALAGRRFGGGSPS